jgi:hypothetical protein
MKKNEIISAIDPLIKAFDELGILYYIGGSIASSAYGKARATMDVDMVLNLQTLHVKFLSEKLNKIYYLDEEMILDAIKTRSSFNLIHLDTMLKIDAFILKDQPYQQAAFERKIRDKLDDEQDTINVYLCSPEDIILNKLIWYKTGGKTSERQWNDVIGVIKVQGENLDKDYLNKWGVQLGIIELLKEAFSECSTNL